MHLPSISRPTRYVLYLLLLTVPAVPATAMARAEPEVEQISFDERSDGAGYVIRFHTSGTVVAYSEPRLIDRDRLEVELFNVKLADSYRHREPNGPVLKYSELARRGHLVFHFRLDPRIPVRTSIYRDRASTDILVALTYNAERPSVLPVPTPAADLAPESSGDGLPSNTAVVAVQKEGKRLLLDTIVIDPGHGGKDPGAISNGVREKDIVLAVSKKLGDMLEQQLGIRVLYTRDDDRFVPLKERGRFANQHGAKLFISIHVNAAEDSRARGTETYFLGTHKTAAARNVMERENEVVKLEEDPEHYAALDEQALIRQGLLLSANMRKGEELSSLIETRFDGHGRSSRGVKQAGFYVLWGASMPAVLVELGFLTNRREASLLSSETGQVQTAQAIFRAIAAYKEQYEKGLLLSSD